MFFEEGMLSMQVKTSWEVLASDILNLFRLFLAFRFWGSSFFSLSRSVSIFSIEIDFYFDLILDSSLESYRFKFLFNGDFFPFGSFELYNFCISFLFISLL